jgi:hypothetical protein
MLAPCERHAWQTAGLSSYTSIAHKEDTEMNSHTVFDQTSGRLVASGDAEIYVEEIGITDGPVLLLHGGFRPIEDFSKVNVMNVPFCEHVASAEFPEVVLPSIGKFLGVDLK